MINNVSENYFPNASMKEYVTKFWFISPCFQAMKKNFLKKNNIKFLDNRHTCEDWIYCYQIFTSYPNTLYTSYLFYFYRIRFNSTTYMLSKFQKNCDIVLINQLSKDIQEVKYIREEIISNEADIWF